MGCLLPQWCQATRLVGRNARGPSEQQDEQYVHNFVATYRLYTFVSTCEHFVPLSRAWRHSARSQRGTRFVFPLTVTRPEGRHTIVSMPYARESSQPRGDRAIQTGVAQSRAQRVACKQPELLISV